MRQVTAAVLIENGRLFITRRGPAGSLAGLWELPGGKIEAGETARECLVRELVEELGMAAAAGLVVGRTIYHYDHGSFEMLAIETTRKSGFELSVHDAFAWALPSELSQYALAPADVELVRQLISSGYWGNSEETHSPVG